MVPVRLMLDDGRALRTYPRLGTVSPTGRLEAGHVEVPDGPGDPVQCGSRRRRNTLIVQNSAATQPPGDAVFQDASAHRHGAQRQPLSITKDYNRRVSAGVEPCHQISSRVVIMARNRSTAAAQLRVGQEKVAVNPRREVLETQVHCRAVTETASWM